MGDILENRKINVARNNCRYEINNLLVKLDKETVNFKVASAQFLCHGDCKDPEKATSAADSVHQKIVELTMALEAYESVILTDSALKYSF